MQSRHFRNSQIGIVLAAANVIAVLLQPAVAAFADRTKKMSMRDLIFLLVGIAGAFAAARCIAPELFPVLAILLVLELTVIYTLQPLMNSLGMQFINAGIGINFGLARGMGSLAYAVVSVLLGVLADSLGAGSIPRVSVVLYIALGIAVYLFTKKSVPTGKAEKSYESIEIQKKNTESLLSFFVHNRKFAVLTIAVSLSFCSHFMINNYLIQIAEHVGGTAKDMGIATGIAAAIELPAMILFGFLVKRIRSGSILKFSLFFFLIKTAATMLSVNVWMLYAAQIFQFCSYALFIPASVYYVNEIIKTEDLAKGQAFMTSAITLGGVVASLLGGWLLDSQGVNGMLFTGLVAAALGFLIGFRAVECGKMHQSEEQPLNIGK